MLVTVDLCPPAQMRGRLAAFAAICGARGSDRRGSFADGPLWHYDDWGGNWADLHHVGGGRVVMVGNDHEYSETHYGPFAEMFGEPETDLLAGAPDWWAPHARRVIAGGERLGFVYGFDGGWRRAAYDLYDGFDSVGMPATDDAHCAELITEFVQGGGKGAAPDPAAVEALIAADADVTVELVRAVIGDRWDAAAGAAAARAFLAAEVA